QGGSLRFQIFLPLILVPTPKVLRHAKRTVSPPNTLADAKVSNISFFDVISRPSRRARATPGRRPVFGKSSVSTRAIRGWISFSAVISFFQIRAGPDRAQINACEHHCGKELLHVPSNSCIYNYEASRPVVPAFFLIAARLL